MTDPKELIREKLKDADFSHDGFGINTKREIAIDELFKLYCDLSSEDISDCIKLILFELRGLPASVYDQVEPIIQKAAREYGA